MSDAARIAGIVNEWFQSLPTPDEQQRDRSALIGDLAYEVSRIRAEAAEEIAVAIDARAQRIRDEAWEPSAGMAMAVLVEEDARIAREHGKESGR